MNCNDHHHNEKFTRRDFLTKTSLGLGALTLGSLINPTPVLGNINNNLSANLKLPHFPAKAKRIIYLFQSGAPSHLD
ncbi:MAG: sulfatase, partial [Flavobacteriaceae bacterium]|nr:sulfatase [Flavobacteriaceae bacterium]